ncbi:alpha-1,4-glucan--maltose-1-phosphate maltosyltransferase [Corynebacterium diphtheriae]|uniref:alpha-1,4-glucan--maltose-1-phosphate maltosyltransferase n=1 Tax=Corynebacterium diphtheriae TaxID=1717 RepID=UPI000260260B|nr:alpha-1,4-glucan--maltose-1-phosphate maltosyltransferase [Corynebacterium diphtheriae]EIK56532.1 putative alpha-amylase [Corynebacterium diphtheriae bv. intermedius str. NCTC 5011]OWM38109.1 alpha-1,4-glucan--maltose-1-phosphate maltosyltransferase [Corynebacterium diphtheriae bv. intermedius]CAB0644314.1 alpha-1,4-glucan--maltose-1-phosphate maltosyltransferase [Corynebacterium diphtheriae]
MSSKSTRLAIEDVRPKVSCGRRPSKAVVGEMIPVSALVWREGHDAIAATLVVTDPTGQSSSIVMATKKFDPDRMWASFVPDRPGTWTFRVDAWSDAVATWRHAVTTKIEAGQSPEELYNDIEHGAALFESAIASAPKAERKTLAPAFTRVINALRSDAPLRTRVAPALSAEITYLLTEHPVRELLTRGHTYSISVERTKALYSSWYELFPRSTGGWDDNGQPVHGTFVTTAQALDRVAAMGFDTVYFPPIHPIGEINRKGKNNTLIALPGDVGSPWAIGSAEGGHDSVHPRLGTIDDFRALVARARELNLEVALDLALQAAPDHPWAKSHPEFFTVLADGSIAFAENPPKKYQDIYPLNFDNAHKKIYAEILRVVLFWVQQGVTTFRVDNPHTKPANFWEWLIAKVHAKHPEVIFLAEAFTHPARLYGLGKVGFSQSYTYFTWKTSKTQLQQFAEEIAEMADVSRPNLFVNTPDILHESLQYGGRAMFAIRATLAATMSPVWGVYSGFELFEHEAVAHGSEEYANSEKYELRPRNFDAARAAGNSLEPYLTLLNSIRAQHPALQQLRVIDFHPTDNDSILAYSKVDPVTGDTIVVVVNLDPDHAQQATLELDMEALGRDTTESFEVSDLVSGQQFHWGQRNFIRLDPCANVAHIVAIPSAPNSHKAQLSWRGESDYRN